MYIVRSFYPGRPGYRLLQETVRSHYLTHFDANPLPRPDQFVCLTGQDGAAPGYACAGLTYGDSGQLFSERYLDKGLDELYGVERAQILEIGAFSAFQPGAGRFLLSKLLRTLALQNYQLVVMTATEKVRELLRPLIVDFADHGPAQLHRVQTAEVDWGSYYDHDPRVVVFSLGTEVVDQQRNPWMAVARPVENTGLAFAVSA